MKRFENYRSILGFSTLGASAAIAIAALIFAGTSAPLSIAQSNAIPTTNVSHPDFSGFWEVIPSSRRNNPPAKLTQQSIDRDKKAVADREAGKVIVYSSRWCNYLGVPFIMGQSPPINIVETNDEVGIYSEQNSAPRHIYLDGRNHPSPSEFASTTNGHSVGHWEGDELVVDTTNFSGKGHPEIPGGGYRGPTSHLVERFKLLDGGKSLSITSSWDDPNVFLEPHTYSVTYRKMPPTTFAYEDSCDASDAAPYENSGGVTDPPDK